MSPVPILVITITIGLNVFIICLASIVDAPYTSAYYIRKYSLKHYNTIISSCTWSFAYNRTGSPWQWFSILPVN